MDSSTKSMSRTSRRSCQTSSKRYAVAASFLSTTVDASHDKSRHICFTCDTISKARRADFVQTADLHAQAMQACSAPVMLQNLIRGRGVFCRSLMKSQLASPTFTPTYAALIAIINTKFPEIGELLLKRVISQVNLHHNLLSCCQD